MPAYLETEQELSRLARRAAGMRGGPRLLILPGMMGSSIGLLRKNGGVDITWFDPVEIAQGQLVKLALPAGNRYWAVGVLKFAYERLRLVLRIAGFDAVFHPYDWRRDILWNGRELGDRLLREKRQDVVLVGHSAGGLVARAALAQGRRAHRPRDPARHAEQGRLRRSSGAARDLSADPPCLDA
jgi:pimeloyl-ACP methyl ester carboxylesterase